MSIQLMPCICCNVPTEYEDIDDKIVIRGSHHLRSCDFYREIKCIECDCVVSQELENNNYHDDMCDECWLNDFNEDNKDEDFDESSFEKSFKCIECDCIVSKEMKNNTYYDDLCNKCWLK